MERAMNIRSKFMRILTEHKGYTLIEMLIALAISGLIAVILLYILQAGYQINGKVVEMGSLEQDIRYLNLYFQKQVLRSEQIYVENNSVFLQDMESSEKNYFNKYRFDRINGRIYKEKVVLKDGQMQGIGAGESSQMANRIRSFGIFWDEATALVQVDITVYDGDITQTLNGRYRYTGEVVYLE